MGNFAPDPGANWSKSAGQAASMARAAYRALNGAITLASVQTTVHPLNESDGSLNLANLALTASVKRALANDVTVCGENEPVAYVTEYFLGDGVTTEFDLAEDPFFPPTSKSTIVSELFNEPEINQTVWNAAGGGYITLGPSGLAMNGGNGIDGETTLAWLDPIEMGGTLLLELVGVTLSPGSTASWADSSTATRRIGLHRGIPGHCATRQRSRDVAADGAGHGGGNHLCGESRQHIHTAPAHSLPGELPRGGDVLLLRR